MKLFKNIQISREYGVNPTTVANWIAASKKGLNHLKIATNGKKDFIIDSLSNREILTILANNGRKHRNKDRITKVFPSRKFYTIFTPDEIIQIFNCLEIDRKIPVKFVYKNFGAKIWNLITNSSYNMYVNIDFKLLQNCLPYLNDVLNSKKKVNIIEFGVGTGTVAIPLIGMFYQQQKLNKYISIDISEEMLKTANRNLQRIYPDLEIESHVNDFETEDFGKIFFQAQKNHKQDEICNLVVCLGRTIGNLDNFKATLWNLRRGLNKNDILIFTDAMDSSKIRTNLDPVLEKNYFNLQTWILRELGIEIDKCRPEAYYNPVNRTRMLDILLDKDYEIEFKLLGVVKNLNLFKNQRITVWKHKAVILEQLARDFEYSGLRLSYLQTHPLRSDVIIVSEVDKLSPSQ